MTKKTIILLASGLFAFVNLLQAQPDSVYPNTLLWRISGNGLSKPSYLFGTMHVTDKRAFNFPDSLYNSLENADAFAMEFHPDSMNAILIEYLEQGGYEDKKKEEDKFSDEDMKELEKSIRTEVKTKLKKRKGDMIRYFLNNIINGERKDDENSMNTFMDAYLFDVAKRNGKMVYGLENGIDQLKALSSLSNGFNKDKLGELVKNWDMKDESPVQTLYFKSDLTGIRNFFTNFYSDSALKIFLYDRNIGMCNGMDTLMHKYQLVTAVGAAHLPGDKGLISLLRKKGYDVEPVFTDNKINAADYKLKEIKTNWNLVKMEEHGFQFEVPVIPQVKNGMRGRKVMIAYDLANGLVYMTISGALTADQRNKPVKEVIKEHADDIIRSAGGKVISEKSISYGGLGGQEMECSYATKEKSRYRELVSDKMFYGLVVISQNNKNLYSGNAEQFLSSFKILEHVKPVPEMLHSENEGFSIRFPGKSNQEYLKLGKDSKDNLTINSYLYFDMANGNNYSMLVSRVKEGSHMINGSSFFDSYMDNIKTTAGTDNLYVTDTSFHGYPARYFISDTNPKDGYELMGTVIKRENTAYFIVVELNDSSVGKKAGDAFIGSFSFEKFKKPDWKMLPSPGKDFKAWTPSGIKDSQESEQIAEEAPVEGRKTYYSFDPNSLHYYYIEKEPVSKYYWAENTDSVYSDWKHDFIYGYNDSVISEKKVKNGGVKCWEIVYHSGYPDQTQRVRLLLNGTDKYKLSTVLDDESGPDADADKFFDAFRFEQEKDSKSIFNNTPETLFRDLQSTDSATFQSAYAAFYNLRFRPAHIPLLLEKSLLPYPKYENNYSSMNDRILYAVKNMKDKKEEDLQLITGFIMKKYPMEDTVIDENRFTMLGILASFKTEKSYDDIIELLKKKNPVDDNAYSFYGSLRDSLLLTKRLFPRLYSFLEDSLSQSPLLSLMNTMLDSNMLSVSDIEPFTAILKGIAVNKAAKLKEAAEDDYDNAAYSLVELMGKMHSAEFYGVTREFLDAKPVSFKNAAAIALIKNDQPVKEDILKEIAADRYYRTGLYTSLEELGKTDLFPAAYATQPKMGEGYLYEALVGDDELYGETEIIYLKRVIKEVKGEKKKFYLYRVNITDEGDDETKSSTTSYLGVAGPFDMNDKIIHIDETGNLSGIYYDDEFTGLRPDDYFEKYFEQQIKWLNE